jgi:predicted TIM-barrel fold metal-dependent hydrolase
MREGYRIIDADRHVMEPLDLWHKHLDPAFRDHAPRLQPQPPEGLAARVERLGAKGLAPLVPPMTLYGKSIFNRMSEQAWVELNAAGYLRHTRLGPLQEPATYLEDLSQTGVDIAFLYPTMALCLEGFAPLEPAVAVAFARAYNDWLCAFCAADPERLRGVGLISLHDPAQMVGELQRVVGFGWKAVVLRPNPVGGRLLSDPAYEPFWTACEAQGVAVAIHEATHAYLPTAGDRFQTRFAQHACSHPMEQMMALLAFIEGGVLERHPGLRVAALEAGCGWLPYWLWRLDAIEYPHARDEVVAHVRRPPSEYFRRQYFATLEPDEPNLEDVIRQIGPDNLLFATDFPHLDHTTTIIDQILALGARLSPEVVRKILWDNPARFYGLDP